MARILTITANPLLDFLSREQLRPGAVTRASTFAPMAAGKGINVARVLVRHGHQACACFFAGGHTGAMLSDAVAADGIDTLVIPTAARMRVGFICAANDEAPQGALLENGFAVSADEAATLVSTVQARISDSDLVIISGSVPDPSVNHCYAAILDACAAAGVPCWVDSYGAAMDAALANGNPPTLSKPNREEFAQSAHWERCGELHITDGGASTTVHHGNAAWKLVPPPVEEVNPVGSGDCYVAGLAHARLSGGDFREQLAYAAACGAANAARWDVAQIGAGPEIDRLLSQCTITQIDG